MGLGGSRFRTVVVFGQTIPNCRCLFYNLGFASLGMEQPDTVGLVY